MTTPLRWIPVVAVLPVAIALSGCDKTLDQGDLEKKIGDNIQTQVGQKVKVKCPSDIKAKKGTTATCTVTLPNGSKVNAKVTLQDDNGKFSYSISQ